MKRHILLAFILIASTAVFCGGAVELPVDELVDKPTLCLVPEMSLIPEVDTWELCQPNDYADSAVPFNQEWAKHAPWATAHVTPAVAKALSRWAKPQMEKYVAVPPLEKLTFKPIAAYKQRGAVVYEATIDTLPVHNPLVTRRLMAYVLYSTESKTILRLTITIRGEVTE